MSETASGGASAGGTLVLGVPQAMRDKSGGASLVVLGRGISALTGSEVRTRRFADYDELLQALPSGQVHLAWLPPLCTLRAVAQGMASPLAVPVRRGVSSYHSVLFCRPDALYTGPADLKGVRAAWVDRHSASGYLVIRAYLRSLGHELGDMFAEELFLGSHEAVADAVAHKRADVGATFYNPAPIGEWGEDTPPASTGWGAHTLRTLIQAGPVPSDLLVASRLLPERLVAPVRSALLTDSPIRSAALELVDAEDLAAPSRDDIEALRKLANWLDN